MLNMLIVEDDPKVASVLRKGLHELDISASIARNGRDALEQIESAPLDMVLLDLGLPDMDGREVLAEIRKRRPNMPVMIVTARDELSDRVAGLDAGADDYLVKPFAFSELLARVRALQRRSRGSESQELRVGELVLDLLNRRVQRAGQPVELTPREFDLLAYLMRNSGQTVSRDMLARDVWKITSRVTSMDNVLDVHMAHLREKIDRPFPTKMLQTIRGVGFVLGPGS
jgi:two-component system, OmpR family, copper resistance phosphate regulon response regulator CusR